MNRPIVGFIIGLLMPLIGFVVVYLVLFRNGRLSDTITYLADHHKELATVLSLSILANLIPFILFNNKRLDQASRGVFVATMIYAVIYILLKFVWN